MKIPSGQYGVIYVDPPWKYKMYGEAGYEKSPQKHYPCMSQEEMLALRDHVLFAAAPNSVMVMWTVFAADQERDFLVDAIELMRAWGFQRKTGGPWVKMAGTGNPSMGTGFILRGAAELFLIGTHGAPKIKNKGTRNLLLTGDWPKEIDDIQEIMVNTLRRQHSRKPDEMIPLIENLFEGPYLELFGRTQRPGWTVAGNQTDKF